MPVADGSSGTPKKKPKRTVKPPSFIGPVIPTKSTSSHPTRPTGSTKTPSSAVKTTANTSPSFIGPVVPAKPKPVVSAPPAYVRPPTRKAKKVTDASAFDGTNIGEVLAKARQKISPKSSGDDDFLRGSDTAGRGITMPEIDKGPDTGITTDPFSTLGSISKFLDARKLDSATDLDDPETGNIEGKSALRSLLDTSRNPDSDPEEAKQSLLDFLFTVRPDNYDPAYGGPAMPERFKHRRGDINAPLRMHWDAEYISSALAEHDDGYASDRATELNSILYAQLNQQEQWAKSRTSQRAYKLGDILGEAGQAAYEGDFDVLANKMENNPDLLEFNSYAQDYTKNPEKIYRDWLEQRNQIKDPYLRKAMAKRVDIYMRHYENVRRYYSTARKVSRDAVAQYEEKYNESVEFRDEDSAGPAIPDVGKEAAAAQKFRDLVGAAGDDKATWAEFYGDEKDGKKVVAKQRQAIKRRLKVKDLPTVREMLAYKVSEGELDPKDEAAVGEWIQRFQNPNHPDTRAMYYGFASSVNKNLDPEKDGLPFINGPSERYIKRENRRADRSNQYLEDTADQRERNEDDSYEGFWDSMGDFIEKDAEKASRALATPFRAASNIITGADRSVGGVTGISGINDPNSTGAVGWTIDKLSRFNYAIAGTINQWNSLDNDPHKATPWHQNLAQAMNPMFWAGQAMGQDPWDSVDEVASSPSKLGGVAKEGYKQFFRGSGLPGTSEDTVPTTFGHVIANNGLRDPEDNIYDNKWYQNITGFALDVGTDPLNFIGVGIVDDVLKVPKSLASGMKAADTDVPRVPSDAFLDDVLSGSRGPAADKAFRTQQAVARLGDESEFGTPTVADEKIIPFQFAVEYTKDLSYTARASEAPRVNIPRFHTGFAAQRKEINKQLGELDALKQSNAYNTSLENYYEGLTQIANDMAFAPVTVPEVRIQKLMARTSTRIKSAAKEGYNFDNLGGQFHQRIIKPLADADVIRAWPDHTSTTRFATDDAGNLTTRAARAKSAMDAQQKNLDAADYYGGTPSNNESWTRAIDEGYDIDEVTGKPSVWEDYDVDSFIDAGAPGLLDNGFDPSKEFASAAGISVEDFSKIWSQSDVLRALHYGPKMLEEQDDVAKALVYEARNRIAQAKRKLATTDKPSVRRAAYRALAMGYSMHSQHTIAGAFRYLDTIRNARATGGQAAMAGVKNQAEIDSLDTIIAKAESELEASYGEVDDLGDYVGGFPSGRIPASPGTLDNVENAIPMRRGSYDEFDFNDKSWAEIAQGTENFTSKSAQMQAIIDSATAKRRELLKGNSDVKLSALDPAEAYDVERLLPGDSMFRKSDGSVNLDKVQNHLRQEVTHTGQAKNGTIKVTYSLPKPSKPKNMSKEQFEQTETWANYRREVAFLDNVAGFVQSRANSMFRTEKTKVIRERLRTTDVKADNTEVDEFFINGKGPAERKLGPRPKKMSDRLPNYTARKQERAKMVRQQPNAVVKDGEIIGVDEAAQVGWGEGLTPGNRTKGQKEVAQNLETLKRQYDAKLARAKEFDKKAFDDLAKSNKKMVDGFRLSTVEMRKVYNSSFHKAMDEAVQDINNGIIRQTPSNTRLPVGDVAKQMEKQLNDELKYEELQLKIQKLEATATDEFRAIEAKRKALIKKRIEMYGRIKKVKYETNLIHKTMIKRIDEDQILQVADTPPVMTGRMMQMRILGMKKNLQWSNNIFDGAEAAAKLVPTKFMDSFKNNWVRPSKQLKQPESIRMRAQREGKTPVIIHANLRNLTDNMAGLSEDARKRMAYAVEKGIPYGGKGQSGFEGVKHELDDIMKIINGEHENYVFARPGEVTGEALGLYEIARFMPEGYSFDPKTLGRARAERANDPIIKSEKAERDPFSPLPDAKSDYTYGELLDSMRAHNGPTAKDIDDPFRVAWVVRLAADQAAQRRSTIHSLGETFGVRIPKDRVKGKVVNKLTTEKYGWSGFQDIPNYIFPPEIHDEIKTFMKLLEPGPESAQITKMFDQAMGYWKQGMTIYNPAYYTRNGIGEMMVSWLDGVNHPKWYRMSYRVSRYLKKTDTDLAELIHRFDALEGTIPVDVAKANEVLFSLKGGQKVRVEDALYWYTNTGMKTTFANTDIGQGVRGLANQALGKGRARNKIAAANNVVHEAGEGFEDYLRMAHFMHAMEHSGKGSMKEAAEYAATRVTRSHFDYTDFSKFEKVVMLRAFPFFKWIRRGAPLMLAHLFMTPGKMAALPKALNTASNIGFDPLNAFNDDPVLSTNDVLDDKNGHLPNYSGIAPGWVRDLFAYAMQPNEDDEYANYFRITTPQIDGLAGALNFIQPYGEKGVGGGLADTTLYPLLNPAVKSAVELGRNQGLDPDFQHQIYGGEFNEAKGINEAEAIGAYAARQVSPHLAFLSKLSSRGKLPDALNITDDDYEHGSDALRDVVSFFSGVGFYQGRQESLPTNENSASSTAGRESSAVGFYDLSDLSMLTGRAGHANSKKNSAKGLTGGLGKVNETTTGKTAGKSGSGWIPNKYGKPNGSGWIPNKYGNSGGSGWVDYPDYPSRGSGGRGGYSGGSSGSSSSSGGFDLLALIRKLQGMVDQGIVIDPERFEE